MIPHSIARFFWDTDPSVLNVTKHKSIIIARVLNYGTLADWSWLVRTYGKNDISSMIVKPDRTSIREPAARLAGILFT